MPQTIASDRGQLASLRVHADDNVRVALKDLPAGSEIDDGGRVLHLTEAIRHKHKFAMHDLAEGDTVIMYGVTVGRATRPIAAGSAITTANTEHSTATTQPQARRGEWRAPDVTAFRNASFDGYHRPNGQVGTENVWLVVPLVFCENRNIEVLRQCVADALGEDPYYDYKRMARELLHGMTLVRVHQLAEAPGDGVVAAAGDQLVLHATQLGELAENAAPAQRHQAVHHSAHQRIGGEAGETVRAAALHAQG
ncbi:Altronate dehydratase [Halomonas chromatireducens]|uniref:Altronate dehydratase n=1 Tax=Halomonas chromatireducens TaxID=507626 RepID=A0A109UM37_9GAMM|nr:Altronate dehydratase [Halomonas chromatireducens]